MLDLEEKLEKAKLQDYINDISLNNYVEVKDVCPACGTTIDNKENTCPECGLSFE